MDFGTLVVFFAGTPIVVLLAAMYWRPALFGVFVLLVFEGALRKWVFPSAQAQIYLIKDVLVIGVYLGFIMDRRKGKSPIQDAAAVKALLIIAFVFGCFEVLNPNSPSVLVGLNGLKVYFLYVPIAFIFPYLFQTKEQFLYWIRAYILMAIPVAVLGFAQIAAGPASFLNTYVSHAEEEPAVLSTFGEHFDLVRTSGTFSYISGYSCVLRLYWFSGHWIQYGNRLEDEKQHRPHGSVGTRGGSDVHNGLAKCSI